MLYTVKTEIRFVHIAVCLGKAVGYAERFVLDGQLRQLAAHDTAHRHPETVVHGYRFCDVAYYAHCDIRCLQCGMDPPDDFAAQTGRSVLQVLPELPV